MSFNVSLLYHALLWLGEKLMFGEPLLIAAPLFLSLVLGSIFVYYKRIREALAKHREARDVVKDIVVSFNNQVQRLEERVAMDTQKLEFLASKREDVTGITKQLKNHETRLSEMTSRMDIALKVKEEFLSHIEELSERMNKIVEAHEHLEKRISKTSEMKRERVIPIAEDRALASVNATELRVLEALTNEGQKTAPEVQHKLGLTREHSARLMKKLYVKGYVERDETKIPFVYRIKEEMREILSKP